MFSDAPRQLKGFLHFLVYNCYYTNGELGFFDCVLSKSILGLRYGVTDRCRVFVTVLAQANQRHFAYTAALDCGLKNKHLTIIFYFVVILVTVAIIFPLKPD